MSSVLQCTLRYAATGSNGWYAVALQIEDFASPSDTIPLSSVPLQFLVLVFTSSAPCASRPEFVEPTRVDGSCVGVPFNTTWHEPLIAQSGAEGVRYIWYKYVPMIQVTSQGRLPSMIFLSG